MGVGVFIAALARRDGGGGADKPPSPAGERMGWVGWEGDGVRGGHVSNHGRMPPAPPVATPHTSDIPRATVSPHPTPPPSFHAAPGGWSCHDSWAGGIFAIIIF